MPSLCEQSNQLNNFNNSNTLSTNVRSSLASYAGFEESFTSNTFNRSSSDCIRIVRPNRSVDGESQAEWADIWWRTVHTTPRDSNPLTSDSNFPRIGSVQMLAGNGFGAPPVVRDIQVDDATFLFAPIVTLQVDDAGLPPDWSAADSRYLTDAVIDAIRPSQDLFYEVNGRSLICGEDWRQHRQQSPTPFSFVVPEDHYVGPDAGYTAGLEVNDSVSDGYWVMLNPLPVGDHTIHFGGTFDFSRIEVEDLNGDGQIGFDPATTLNPTAQQVTELFLQIYQSFGTVELEVTYNVHVTPHSTGNSCSVDLSALVTG